MKKYIVNIFKTYRLSFIATSALNLLIFLNLVSYAMLGFPIIPTSGNQGLAQFCLWIITIGAMLVIWESDSHTK